MPRDIPTRRTGGSRCRPQADWLDPLIALSFAAAATSTIRLATGVLLLPEHNPLLLAKQVASLDALSRGRLSLGVGVGWSREEFDALGVPFERRGTRADEYLAAMRTVWRDDVASFAGEFVSFAGMRVNPRPVRDRRIPIVVGGNSDAALRRAARLADGWYGFNLEGAEHVRERLERLRRAVRRRAVIRPNWTSRSRSPATVRTTASGSPRSASTSSCWSARRRPIRAPSSRGWRGLAGR